MGIPVTPGRSGPRWWQIILVVLLGLALAAGLFVTLMFASLVGAVGSALGSDGPEATDPAVVQAREQAAADLEKDTGLLVLSVVLPALDGSREVGSEDVVPACHEGQHNWKIDDDFDLSCSMAHRRLVAVPTAATFPADMQRVDKALRAQGWHSGALSIPEVLTGYGDLLAEPRYALEDLPSAGYERRLVDTTRTLAISWEPPGAGSTGYTLVVTESKEYFRG